MKKLRFSEEKIVTIEYFGSSPYWIVMNKTDQFQKITVGIDQQNFIPALKQMVDLSLDRKSVV